MILGSSPRVRGTRNLKPFLKPSATVHPRACGELNLAICDRLFPAGSSPRVRGTPDRPSVQLDRERFIPARAGNSPSAFCVDLVATVHPRACGELSACRKSLWRLDGSSPRVRGTLVEPSIGLRQFRFIPARAGNSRRMPSRPPLQPVHPRACGELTAASGNAGMYVGSSPRVRGTRRGSDGRQ